MNIAELLRGLADKIASDTLVLNFAVIKVN